MLTSLYSNSVNRNDCGLVCSCGKTFFPPVYSQWTYFVKYRGKKQLCCSYHCMLKLKADVDKERAENEKMRVDNRKKTIRDNQALNADNGEIGKRNKAE